MLPFAKLFLRVFEPAMAPPHPREMLRGAIGVMVGLLLTDLVLWVLAGAFGISDAAFSIGGLLAHPALIAPLAASAVLIYAVPASPLAQPWSVIVGNTLSALCALIVLQLGLPVLPGLCLAVLLALVAMGSGRALHPPGGAVAVSTVLAASAQQMPGLAYLLLTVGLGSALLVGFGVVWNRATARTYPFRVGAAAAASPALPPDGPRDMSPLVLAAALDRLRLGATLGVDDLGHLITLAEQIAADHGLGLTAAAMMTQDPVTLSPEADWRTMSALFVQHGFRCLPVAGGQNQFLGLIPVHILLRPGAQGLSAKHLLQQVACLSPEATLAQLLPCFAQGRQTAVPILTDGALTGIITRSDILAALVHKMAAADA